WLPDTSRRPESPRLKGPVHSCAEVILVLAMGLSWMGGLTPARVSALAQQTALPSSTQPLPEVSEVINKGFELLSRNEAAGAEAEFRKAIDLQPELEM